VQWIVYDDVNPEGAELARNGTNPCNRVLPHTKVDPNRNFPPMPDNCNIMGNFEPVDEECAGTQPLSEPETRALAQAMRAAMPLDMALFVHSGGVAILSPYDGCLSRRPRNYVEHLRWSHRMAKQLPREWNVTIGSGASALYPASGTASDWAYHHLGIPLVFTLETYGKEVENNCTQQFVPSDTQQYVDQWSLVWDLIENGV
jgi:hypothetical protein